MNHTVRCAFLCAILLSLTWPGWAEPANWHLPAWRCRVPVQVYNATGTPKTALLLSTRELPFTALISAGKLAPDGRDLRLLDAGGNELPLRAEHLASDNGDARLCFFVRDVGPRAKARLWLYYGNPQAPPGQRLRDDEVVPLLAANQPVTCGAEETRAPEPAAQADALARFLRDVRLIESESQAAPGFQTVTLPASDDPRASGNAFTAAKGAGTLTFDLELPAGAVTCWVRYCPSADVKVEPAGRLVLALRQGGQTLARQVIDLAPPADEELMPGDDLALDPGAMLQEEEALLRERTAFRWAPLRATAQAGAATLVITSEQSRAALDCAVLAWDARYQPDVRDFLGRVWVRWRIDAPADVRHTAFINSQVVTMSIKGPQWEATGTMGAYGLLPDEKMPLDDGDALRTGQFSPWVLLPTSKAYTWFTTIRCLPRGGAPAGTVARMEFANRPDPGHVFHVTAAEPLDLNGTLFMRMPTDITVAALNRLETFTEWAHRRLGILTALKLGPPPRLQRLRVGTWAQLQGNLPRERAEVDFRIFEQLGLNMVSPNGVSETVFAELAKAHGIIDTNCIAWGSVANYAKREPFSSTIASRFNMGDEIGPSTTAPAIEKDPQLLARFREWLQGQGLTPAQLGVAAWDQVYPTEDRRLVGGAKPPPPPNVKAEDIENPLPEAPDDPGDPLELFKGEKEERPGPAPGTLEAARLFSYTRRFIDAYTAESWRTATRDVLKYYPKARLISPNYQAGPMQAAFLGNNNDTYRDLLDIFDLTRSGAFKGVGMEDWVHGWDGGINNICFAAEIMRGACRKGRETLSSLLVGGEAIRAKLYGFLMHGVKDNDLYYYGPVRNIGPVWAEQPRAYAELAESTREIKQFEDAIADGELRPRKAAMLVAYSSEIMQKGGLYFCGLRQQTYAALKHSYTQVDVICEQEVLEDDILRQYDLLFLTDPNTRAAAQVKIAAWVKDGGRLWACAGAACWDELNQPCVTLDPVFGVAKRAMVKDEATTLTAESPLFGGKVELPTTGQRLDAAPTTAQVLGTYADGKPAVFLNAYGKGEALLVGALVGSVYWQQHYAKGSITTPGGTYTGGAQAQRLVNALVDRAKVERPVTLSTPGIITSVMDSPRGTLVFLNNATYSAQNLDPARPAPTVTARVRVNGPVAAVQSAKHGKLTFEFKDGELTFTLPVPNADVILVK